MACEIMIATPAVRALIRDDKAHQLQGVIEIGQQYGMQTMNSALAKLYQKGQISMKDALGKSPDPANLQKLLGNAGGV